MNIEITENETKYKEVMSINLLIYLFNIKLAKINF